MAAVTLKQYDHIDEVSEVLSEHSASGYAQVQLITFHSSFPVLCH